MPDELYNYLRNIMFGSNKELAQQITSEIAEWSYKTPAIQKLVWEGLTKGSLEVKANCAYAIEELLIHGDESKRAEIKEFFAEYPDLIHKLDPSEEQYIHLHILDAMKDK